MIESNESKSIKSLKDSILLHTHSINIINIKQETF